MGSIHGPGGHMLRLIVKQESKLIAELEVEDRVTIGRSRKAGLRLDRQTISTQHAIVSLEGGFPFVSDLGSRNGTFLNGSKLDPEVVYPLQDGDHLSLSTFQITVELTDETAPLQDSNPAAPDALSLENEADFGQTFMVSGPEQVRLRNRVRFEQAHPRLITVVAGKAMTLTFPELEVLIGRDKNCDLALDHDTVSGRHARLRSISGTYLLRDLNSTNGTTINGEPVRDQAVVKPGDVLGMGDSLCLFTANDPKTGRHSVEADADAICAVLVSRGRFAAEELEQHRAEAASQDLHLLEHLVVNGLLTLHDWLQYRQPYREQAAGLVNPMDTPGGGRNLWLVGVAILTLAGAAAALIAAGVL